MTGRQTGLVGCFMSWYETLEKRHCIELINDGIQNVYKIELGANLDIFRNFNNWEGLHPFHLHSFPIKAT